MRSPNRISICLKLLFPNKTLYSFLGENVQAGYTKKIHNNWDLIEKKWLENPDQRFGQLLSNMGLVSKEIENHIWNIEEDDWLINNGYVNIENIKFWGVSFYKNGKKRKKIKYVLLKDLKTDHIINIIKFFEGNLNKIRIEYLKYFNKRINESK